MTKRGALADDSFKVHFAAQLVLEIELFLRQPVFQLRNFAIRQRVFHANGNLIRHLGEESYVIIVECVFLVLGDGQDSQQAVATDEWNVAERVQPFANSFVIHLRRHLSRIEAIDNHRLATLEGVARHRPFDRHQRSLSEHASAVGIIERVHAQMFAFSIGEHHGRGIAFHHAPHASGSGVQKIAQLKIGHDLVGQIEDEFELILHSLRDEEVDGSVDREADLLGHQAEKLDLLGVIGIWIAPAQAEYAQAPAAANQRHGAG